MTKAVEIAGERFGKVNRAKSDLTESAFLAMVDDIHKHLHEGT
jgi:hypothetical protein